MLQKKVGLNKGKLFVFSLPALFVGWLLISIIFFVIFDFVESSENGIPNWLIFAQSLFNRLFGILALISIPLTIAGIYMIINSKKTDKKEEEISSSLDNNEPHSTIKSYSNNFLSILRLSFDTVVNKIKGRIGVGQYWIASGRIVILSVIMNVLYFFMNQDIFWILNTISGLVSLFLIIFLITRRLNDIGKSGWYILLLLIPFVNIYWMIKIFFQKGELGSNKYGENPLKYQPKENTYYRVIYILFVLIQIGITFGSMIATEDILIEYLIDQDAMSGYNMDTLGE